MKTNKDLVIMLEVMMNNNQCKISDTCSKEDLEALLRIVKGGKDEEETPFPTILFPVSSLEMTGT